MKTAFKPAKDNARTNISARNYTNSDGRAHTERFSGKYSGAFTLAEVLITLGIIGIVAAMTLPTLIKNNQRKETEARLQKAYSTISQAFLSAQAKHGEAKYWPEWDDAETILTKYIAPEIKGAKVFPTNTSIANLMCYEGKFHSGVGVNDEATQYIWMDKVYLSTPFLKNNTASIKLMDGTCIGLNKASEKYSKQMFIDTNGSYRAPNMAGKDLFFFVVEDNNIKPRGYDWTVSDLFNPETGNSCHGKALHGGLVCAAKIMGDGWTIKYW